jgi:hypothetical protein
MQFSFLVPTRSFTRNSPQKKICWGEMENKKICWGEMENPAPKAKCSGFGSQKQS